MILNHEPVKHCLVDNVFDAGLLGRVAEEIPLIGWPGWVRYDNDCERLKRTCVDLPKIGPATVELFASFQRDEFMDGLKRLLDVHCILMSDPFLHGGGIHVTDPGGWLSPHLDYSRHPKAPEMERRLNLILFLNPHWPRLWGGALQFLDVAGDKVVSEIYPQFGRMVVWESADNVFHGTGRVSEKAHPRLTAACYYLSPARPGSTRTRALFVPNRGPK